MADVFVSYRREDRSSVEEIVQGLEAEGLSVWWDQGIIPAEDWRATITHELSAARCVLTIWSHASIDPRNGRWVQQEAEAGDARGVYVPVCIDDVLPPLGLRHIQAADLIDWRGNRTEPRWRAIVEIVRATLEGRKPEPSVARPQVKPGLIETMQGRWPAATLALGLAALVGFSLVNLGPLVMAGIVSGAVVCYLAINALIARRRGERAASNLIRSALAVSWFTYVANAIVWSGAGLAAYAPAIEATFSDEFVVSVVDELDRPLSSAVVTAAVNRAAKQIPLDKDGKGTVRLWRFDPDVVLLRFTYGDSAREVRATRKNGRFENVMVVLPSRETSFRVAHWSAEGIAIDALPVNQAHASGRAWKHAS